MIINWQQFTKHAESLKPMHAENGCLGKARGCCVARVQLR